MELIRKKRSANLLMYKEYDIQIGDRYGVISGSQRLVFIKTGRGGTIFGHQNKYLKLAAELSARTGYSVVVSANPPDSACELSKEISEIADIAGEPDVILFAGVSNGALIGAQQGWTVEKIRAMLLINGPLMINWAKTKKGLEKFRGEMVELIYGSRDPSFPYVGMLDRIASDVCRYRVIEGIDHSFTGKQEVLFREVTSFIIGTGAGERLLRPKTTEGGREDDCKERYSMR